MARRRNQTGMYLIELVTAVAISGFLAIVLGQSLSQSIQLSSKTQDKLLACEIGQQVLDRVRNTPFNQLPAPGTYNIRINLSNPSSDPYTVSNTPIAVVATHIDSVNLAWSGDGTSTVPTYGYMGGATLQIQSIDANTLACTVTVTRPASGSYSIGTVVSRYGICATN